MPLELSERRKRTRQVKAVLRDGETITFSFKPALFNGELEEAARSWQGGQSGNVAQQLATLVTETDITDGGKPIPISQESFAQLDLEVMQAMMDAITESITVPPA